MIYDELEVTQAQIDVELSDDEEWGRARKSGETHLAHEIERSRASRGEKSPLIARGDLHGIRRVRTSGRTCENRSMQGRPAGAIPAASTTQLLPSVEYMRTKVVSKKQPYHMKNRQKTTRKCQWCNERTGWIISYNRFLRVRKCFRCMTDLERAAVALFYEETRKVMRVKAR